MSIECYCEPAEGEPWSWWRETWQRARKEHKCCECLEIIKRGERYQRISGMADGQIETFKTCEFCAKEYERINSIADYVIPKHELACALVAELRGDL